MSYTHVQLMLRKELEKLCNVFGSKTAHRVGFKTFNNYFSNCKTISFCKQGSDTLSFPRRSSPVRRAVPEGLDGGNTP